MILNRLENSEDLVDMKLDGAYDFIFNHFLMDRWRICPRRNSYIYCAAKVLVSQEEVLNTEELLSTSVAGGKLEWDNSLAKSEDLLLQIKFK